jgi:hypothetical protein
MSHAVTVPGLLGRAVLDIECLDRIYLNGYVPLPQAGGQVLTFLRGHLGTPAASPRKRPSRPAPPSSAGWQ